MAAIEHDAPVAIVRLLQLLTSADVHKNFESENHHLLGREVSTDNTALHYAAYSGRFQLVDALLERWSEHEIEFVSEFLSIGLNKTEKIQLGWRNIIINARNKRGETALYLAPDVDTARRLLHYGADPTIQVRIVYE